MLYLIAEMLESRASNQKNEKKRKKQEYKTRKKIVVRMQACVLFTLYLLSIAMLRIKIESPNAVYHRYALNIQRLKKKREKDPENSCVDVWRSVNRVLSSCMRWKTCKKRELGSWWTTILGCPSEMTGVLDTKFDDNGTILTIIVLAQ